METRSVRSVPIAILVAAAFFLCLQIAWQFAAPRPGVHAQALPPAPSSTALAAASLGEPIATAQMLALWLQAFDNQPGASVPFRDLDYPRVIQWLDAILELDPQGQYPLLLATHLYSQVPDEARQRLMLDFAYRRFFADPNRRWQWLAHAALVARHRLHDLPLALKYAEAIAKHATSLDAPHWAQQMPIFILEEMGETERARILLGALLANGTLTDPREIRLLAGRLNQLEQKTVEKSLRTVK